VTDGWAPLDPAPDRPPPAPMPPLPDLPPPPLLSAPVSSGPLPLYPMSVGDVLDGAFKLLRANARTILTIVAAISLPLQVVSSFALRRSFSPGLLNILGDPTVAEAAADQSVDDGQLIVQLATVGLALLATPFIAGAVSRVVAASYLGRSMGPAEALKGTVRRFGALLVAFVVVHLLELVGLLACGVGAIAVMGLCTMVAPAIIVEDLGPIAGVKRSWRLGRKRFWGVVGISVLAGIISSTLGNILGTAPQLVALFLGGDWAWVLIAIAAVAASMVSAPVVSIVATLLYFDARIRHEGFDLQVMARELTGATPA
jgi:hypothetical protein